MTAVDPRLELLRPDPAAREAAARLGVSSATQLLAVDPATLDPELRDLATRASLLMQRLAELSERRAVSPQALATPIEDVVEDRRARRLLQRLGVGSIAEYLATSNQTLLAQRGLGARTLETCERSIRRALDRRAPTLLEDLLPDISLDRLPLADEVRSALQERALHRLHDAAQASLDTLSPSLRDTIRSALQRVWSSSDPGERRPAKADVEQPALRRLVRSALARLSRPAAVQVLRRLLGFECRPRRVRAIAAELKIEPDEVLALAAEAIEELRTELAAELSLLCSDLDRELAAAGGVLDAHHVDRGSRLGRTLAGHPGDFVLRLLAALDPDRLSFDGQRLIELSRPRLIAVNRALGRVLQQLGPRPLAHRAERRLARAVDGDLPEALFSHLLERHHGRSLRFRAHGAPRIVELPPRPADRLQRILEDVGRPLHLDDLQFHYRDRHRHASRRRIHQTLRGDRRFVETAPCCFELRATLLDEIETARPFAEHFRDLVVQRGVRTSVFEPFGAGDQAPSSRTAHLAIDRLRQDRAVRYLGRGDFVPGQGRRGSPVVEELVEDLRRAMGELPFARFLQNQPPRRRALVARLLRENRRFVFPTRDRVDLLDNYPFGQERLRQLIRETDMQLEDHNGHASIEVLAEAVDRAGLGGVFLTHHLLLDLLRRHGDFEILPGPVVARADLGLGAWIQRTARDVLRSSGAPLSAAQVLAHSPELAEFESSLEPMLDLDPLVHTPDGLHYQLT